MVVAGKDDLGDLLLVVALSDHIPTEDLQQTVPLPNLLPQVSGCIDHPPVFVPV